MEFSVFTHSSEKLFREFMSDTLYSNNGQYKWRRTEKPQNTPSVHSLYWENMENPSKSIVLRWKQKHYFVIWNFGWHIKQTISEPVVIFKSLYRGKSLNTEVKLAANRLHPFGSLAVWRPGGSDK